MYIVNRGPMHQLTSMRDAMNRIFDENFARSGDTDMGDRMARLPIDVYSTEDELVVTASIPGIKPEDVNITIEGETLTISGEVPALIENVNYIFAERFHGRFSRTLQLNVPIDLDNADATFKDGLLELVLPKTEAVKPHQIKVKNK